MIQARSINLSNESMAEMLNQQGQVTPQGKPYTRQIIENCLYRLRRPAAINSSIFKLLISSIATGAVTLQEAAMLTMPRRGVSA